MENELKQIDKATASKIADYLASIDYNESFIEHFLDSADKEPNPIDYVKKKFPDIQFE